MPTHEFFRELHDLTPLISRSIPPTVLIESPEGIHQDWSTAYAECEFLLAINMNQATLGSLALDDLIHLQDYFKNRIELLIAQIRNLQSLFTPQQSVELLELRRHLEVRLGQFHSFSQHRPGLESEFLRPDISTCITSPPRTREIVAADDLQRDEHILSIWSYRARLADHIESPRADAVGRVHLDHMRIAHALLLNQLEPMA